MWLLVGMASGGYGFWWGGVLRNIGYRFLFIGFWGMGRNVWKYCIFADGGGWAAALG